MGDNINIEGFETRFDHAAEKYLYLTTNELKKGPQISSRNPRSLFNIKISSLFSKYLGRNSIGNSEPHIVNSRNWSPVS